MITAQKARNIQMLQIGYYEGHIKTKIIDAALEGRSYTNVPTIQQEDHKRLTDAGFDVNYDKELGEYEIIWSK